MRSPRFAARLAALLCTAAIAVPCPHATADDDARQRILIVADERAPMDVLARFLDETAGNSVRYAEPKDVPDDLSGYLTVLMYIHKSMQPTVEKALIHYTETGGRMLVLHHGIASAKVKNPVWMRFTGMHIAPRNHPDHPWRVLSNTTHTMVNLSPGHYVTSHKLSYPKKVAYRSSDGRELPTELSAFDLPSTEVFLNQQFTDGREKTVLFGFRCIDDKTGKVIMQDRSAWYKPAGKGHLFYLQPGHSPDDFRNARLLQVIWNCLTWRPVAPAFSR